MSTDLKTFTCYAGCVTRDAFRFLNSDEYKPVLSLGFCNIAAYDLTPFPIDADMLSIGANYEKRNIIIDINKQLTQKIIEADTDWFIFDVISERLPIMKFACNTQDNVKSVGYATKTLNFVDNWYGLIKKGYFNNLKKERDYFQDELFDELDYENKIREFCKGLLDKYPSDKIIFNEVYLNKYYLTKDKKLECFNDEGGYKIQLKYNNFAITNPFLTRVTNVIKQCLPDINYIKMPEYSYSDESHWFGLHPLHFSGLYYGYVADCIKIITDDNLSPADKKVALNLLFEMQGRNNKFYIDTAKQNTKQLTHLQTEEKLHNKWKTYSIAFKRLLTESCLCSKNELAASLIKKGIYNFAIYGNTEITKVLIELLKDTKVRIDYIVENVPVNGITTLLRNKHPYPQTSFILIADVENYDTIVKRLDSGSPAIKYLSIEMFCDIIKNN